VIESDQDRPVIEMKPNTAGIPVVDGKFNITLKPFASAVLTAERR
jgi:hypothetical protein